MRIYGINPVTEALRAGRVVSIRTSPRADQRVAAITREAEAQGVPVQRVSSDEIDRAATGRVHQGVVAEVRLPTAISVRDLVGGAKAAPLILVLDGIEDPHNFGAILRSVDAAGA